MSKWIVLFYTDEDGNCKIKEFIDSLTTKQQAKVISWIDMLEQEGPLLTTTTICRFTKKWDARITY